MDLDEFVAALRDEGFEVVTAADGEEKVKINIAALLGLQGQSNQFQILESDHIRSAVLQPSTVQLADTLVAEVTSATRTLSTAKASVTTSSAAQMATVQQGSAQAALQKPGSALSSNATVAASALKPSVGMPALVQTATLRPGATTPVAATLSGS